MKSNILSSMLVIALAAGIIGGATAAMFTARGSTDAGDYITGTVAVNAEDTAIINSSDLSNIAPGDTVEGEFTVANNGTLDIWYNAEALASGDLFAGETPAEVEIGKSQGSLSEGEETTLNFTVTLPLEANNEYQGAEGELQFVVYAEQKDNNPTPSWQK
jgi:hypothetical protein